MPVIAGIGARVTPSEVMDMMTFIGVWCRENDIWVRSGHADGADWAFEVGAQEKCIAYLPWASFNAHLESKAQKPVMKPNCHTLKITEQFHPAFKKLTYNVLCLMCRNVNQVLGKDLNSPVSAVVCWTADGLDSGGTGQAIRIARHHKIPVLNMKLDQYNTHQKVQDELSRILEITNSTKQ
jgi:hypothetical protein